MDGRVYDVIAAIGESLGVRDLWVTQPRIGSPDEAHGSWFVMVTRCGMLVSHIHGTLTITTDTPDVSVASGEQLVREAVYERHHSLTRGRYLTEDMVDVVTDGIERLAKVTTVADMWKS